MGVYEDTKVDAASPVREEIAEIGSIKELQALHTDGVDPVFEHQARLVNHAVQVIGMGKYQWALFVLCGYGWLCDQVRVESRSDTTQADSCSSGKQLSRTLLRKWRSSFSPSTRRFCLLL